MSRDELLVLLFLLMTSPSTARAQIELQAAGGAYSLQVRTWHDIPFRTVVRQQYDYSCGSAALATLLRYHYGRPVGEAEIFQAMYKAGNQEIIRKLGFSLLDMKRYLASIGLQADGYRMSLEEIARTGVPVVTVITIGQYRHFVILKGIAEGMVLVGDPAAGLHKMPIAAFEKSWSGVVFAIHNPGLKGVFNAAAEWLPYSPAPVSQELDRSSLMSIGAGIAPPVIYQVVQATSLTRPLP